MPRIAELTEQGAIARAARRCRASRTPTTSRSSPALPPVGARHARATTSSARTAARSSSTDPPLLRAPTIPTRSARRRRADACVTAKDKLRRLLAAGGVPCVSGGEADSARRAAGSTVRRADRRGPMPGHLRVGLLATTRSSSASRSPSGSARALAVRLADRLRAARARARERASAISTSSASTSSSARTSTRASTRPRGRPRHERQDAARTARPNVRYLGDELDGAGVGAHVVLPITDPYVVHHAALGSACWVLRC